MTIMKLSRHNNPRIAEGAVYVVEDGDVEQTPISISYGRLKQRLIRADHEMLVTRIHHNGKFVDQLSKGAGELGLAVCVMDQYVEAVSRTRKQAFDFQLREDRKLAQVVEHEPGRFYNRLSSCIWKIFNPEFGLERFELSPRAEVFHDAMQFLKPQAGHMTECFNRFPTSWDRVSERFCGEFANEVGAVILHMADVRKLDSLVKKWSAAGERTRSRMHEFVKKCIGSHSEILVLHLDTDYGHDIAENISPEQAKRDHATFVNRLRANARLAAVAIGGIWTLEWAKAKGHHFRWVFMLDASLTVDSTEWAGLIGSIWTSVVPNNAGHVHFAGVNAPVRPAAGVIHVGNSTEMGALADEIDYLVVKDQYLRPKSLAGQRSWGTWVPAYTREGHRGRRRTDGHHEVPDAALTK